MSIVFQPDLPKAPQLVQSELDQTKGTDSVMELPEKLEKNIEKNVFGIALPIIFIVIIVIFVVYMIRSRMNSMLMGVGGMAGFTGVMMAFRHIRNSLGGDGPRIRESIETSKDYYEYLEHSEQKFNELARQQFNALIDIHREPESIRSDIGTGIMWSRSRKADPQFGVLRIGVGNSIHENRPTLNSVVVDKREYEPGGWAALNMLLNTHSIIRDMPQVIDFMLIPGIVLSGSYSRAWLRAVLLQGCFYFPPDDFTIIVLTQREEWSVLKWSQHAQEPTLFDELGPIRLVTDDMDEFHEYIRTLTYSRTAFQNRGTGKYPLVMIIADVDYPVEWEKFIFDGGTDGVCIIDLSPQIDIHHGLPAIVPCIGIEVVKDELFTRQYIPQHQPTEWKKVATPDGISLSYFRQCLRKMARYHIGTPQDNNLPVKKRSFIGESYWEMLGIEDPENIDFYSKWQIKRFNKLMEYPIGWDIDTGERYTFIWREINHGGFGSHITCAGATGSGKSVHLRSAMLGTYYYEHPEQVQEILIDMKGGATINDLVGVPHVQTILTNTAEDMDKFFRAITGIYGEINHREEVFKHCREGGVENLAEYWMYRNAHPELDLENIPRLNIRVDELAEGLKLNQKLNNLLDSISAKGRSLGIAIQLGTQKPETYDSSMLKNNFGARFALRINSPEVSRSYIGSTVAFQNLQAPPGTPDEDLPKFAGRMYVWDSGNLRYVKNAFPAEKYYPSKKRQSSIRRNDGAYFPPRDYIINTVSRTDIVIDQADNMHAADTPGIPFDKLFIEQLQQIPRPDNIRQYIPDPIPETPLTYQSNPKPVTPDARIVVGDIDDPYNSVIAPFTLPLHNNIHVMGDSGTGKSHTLATMLLAAANTYSAHDVQIMGIEYSGMMSMLDSLPHVIDIAKSDNERAVNGMRFVHNLIEKRRRKINQFGLRNIEEYFASEYSQDDQFKYVILAIDPLETALGNYGMPLLTNYNEMRNDIVYMLSTGAQVGIYVWYAGTELESSFSQITSKTPIRVFHYLTTVSGKPWPSFVPSKDPYHEYRNTMHQQQSRFPSMSPGWTLYPESPRAEGTFGRPLFCRIRAPRLIPIQAGISRQEATELSAKMLQEREPNIHYPRISVLPRLLEYVPSDHKDIILGQVSDPYRPYNTTLQELSDGLIYYAGSRQGKTNFINVALTEISRTQKDADVWLFDYVGKVATDRIHVPNMHTFQGRTDVTQGLSQLEEYLVSRDESVPMIIVIDDWDQLPIIEKPGMIFPFGTTMWDVTLNSVREEAAAKNISFVITCSAARIPNGKDSFLANLSIRKAALMVGQHSDKTISIPGDTTLKFNPEQILGRVKVRRKNNYYLVQTPLLFKSENEHEEW